jgi:hypothetical protein
MIPPAPEVRREPHFIGPLQWSPWKNLGWTKICDGLDKKSFSNYFRKNLKGRFERRELCFLLYFKPSGKSIRNLKRL